MVRPMSEANARVTVFVPTWNGGARLDAVLAAVRGQRTARRVVLRATDSGSTDGTLEVLARHGVAVERIAQSDFDHGATRGRAILACDTELVVLLTQDARPFDEHWLDELLAPFDDPRVAGAWSRQVARPNCHPFKRASLASQPAADEARAIEPLTLAQWNELAPAERLARLGFDDVSSAVRRSAVERVPFPSTPFGEDMLWARAALLGGWRLVFAGASKVEHSHDLNWSELTRRVEQSYSLRRLVADERPFEGDSGLARSLYLAARGNLRIALRGPGISPIARLCVAVQALPFAYLQITSARRGSRAAKYEPPNAS
jgi:rhamnosyltransferase